MRETRNGQLAGKVEIGGGLLPCRWLGGLQLAARGGCYLPLADSLEATCGMTFDRLKVAILYRQRKYPMPRWSLWHTRYLTTSRAKAAARVLRRQMPDFEFRIKERGATRRNTGQLTWESQREEPAESQLGRALRQALGEKRPRS